MLGQGEDPWVAARERGLGRGLAAKGRGGGRRALDTRARAVGLEVRENTTKERRRYSGGRGTERCIGFVFISWAFGFRIEIVGPIRNIYFLYVSPSYLIHMCMKI